MTGLIEVFVDRDRIGTTDVITVLVDPLICALRLNFSDVLSLVAFYTKSQVDGVFGPAVRSMSDFVSRFPNVVCEKTCRDYMVAAHGVRSA